MPKTEVISEKEPVTTAVAPRKVLIKVSPANDVDYIRLKTEIGKLCAYVNTNIEDVGTNMLHITEDVNLARKMSIEVKNLRKVYKDPPRTYLKMIDDAFDELSIPLEQAREDATDSVNKYNRQQREKQRLIDAENARLEQAAIEAQRVIDERNAELKRESIANGNRGCTADGEILEDNPVVFIAPEPQPVYIKPVSTIESVKTDLGSSTEKMVPKYELVNIREVPINLLLLNEKAIRAMLRSGVREIEGLRIWEEPEIKWRVK